ncbi:division/cell wall cluster transcriptional repressor MraZ [Terrarubrum flagellatum]|uniref:division/cell wall cluster transcriptional repressor MraZ n=1 Tax=Terrirubrum flagellatum TaxID=2895980 RepID=UPI0031456283
MDLFVSHVTMRLDAKGRVSIPASFRAVLAKDGYEGIYLHPSLDRPALDAGGHALIHEIEALLSQYDPFSDAWEVFSTALHGESEQVKMDGEGRVQLPERLKTSAFIKDEATFVGLGHKFQIWEPQRFAAHRSEATEKVRAFRRELGSRSPSGARDR